MKISSILLMSLLIFTAPIFAQDRSEAESFFGQYQERKRAFDPSVADLYCDAAIVRTVRIGHDGQPRNFDMSGQKYKQLSRAAMALAEAHSDYSTYTNVQYTDEGGNVRITASRQSSIESYSSPFSLLVGACKDAGWGILEETSQFRLEG